MYTRRIPAPTFAQRRVTHKNLILAELRYKYIKHMKELMLYYVIYRDVHEQEEACIAFNSRIIVFNDILQIKAKQTTGRNHRATRKVSAATTASKTKSTKREAAEP